MSIGTFFLALLACGAQAQQTTSPAGAPAHPQSAPTHPQRRTAVPALPPVALPAEPGAYAVLYTTSGNIVCRLFDKDAPKAVANFVGLAMGTKAWTDPVTGKVLHRPFYSGLTFHRVIPDFMIQGGDPVGDGTGSPGYTFEDELGGDHVFDRPGILAMANAGPNTNGSQFFITVAAVPRLDHKYTIFGEVVTGQDVADAISKVERNENDKPLTPVKIVRIMIRRVPATPAKPPASKPGPGNF